MSDQLTEVPVMGECGTGPWPGCPFCGVPIRAAYTGMAWLHRQAVAHQTDVTLACECFEPDGWRHVEYGDPLAVEQAALECWSRRASLDGVSDEAKFLAMFGEIMEPLKLALSGLDDELRTTEGYIRWGIVELRMRVALKAVLVQVVQSTLPWLRKGGDDRGG